VILAKRGEVWASIFLYVLGLENGKGTSKRQEKDAHWLQDVLSG